MGLASFCNTDAIGLLKMAAVVANAAVTATETVGPTSGT
tara:strand:+ start:1031 stop:1147 length:117 start_codon:yes stop_codon:yes gene_type:complete